MRQSLRVASRARTPSAAGRADRGARGAARGVRRLGRRQGRRERRAPTRTPARYAMRSATPARSRTSERSRSRARPTAGSPSASRSGSSRSRSKTRRRPLARHGRGSGDRQYHLRRCRRSGVPVQRVPPLTAAAGHSRRERLPSEVRPAAGLPRRHRRRRVSRTPNRLRVLDQPQRSRGHGRAQLLRDLRRSKRASPSARPVRAPSTTHSGSAGLEPRPRHRRLSKRTRPAAGRRGHRRADAREPQLQGDRAERVRRSRRAPLRRIDRDQGQVRVPVLRHRLRAGTIADVRSGAVYDRGRRRPCLGYRRRDELPSARRTVPRRQLRPRAARARERARRADARGRRAARPRRAGRRPWRDAATARHSRALLRPKDYRGALIGIRPAGVARATFEALGGRAKGFPAIQAGWPDSMERSRASTRSGQRLRPRRPRTHRERRALAESDDDRHEPERRSTPSRTISRTR